MVKRNKVQTYIWLTVPIRKWLEAESESTGLALSEIVRTILAEKMKVSGNKRGT